MARGALTRQTKSVNFEARFLLAHCLFCIENCWGRSACKSSFCNGKACCNQVVDAEVVVDLVQGGRCHELVVVTCNLLEFFWMNLA